MNNIASALVTGATGFIGAHLVRRLIEQGVFTYCLVRREPSSHETQRLAGSRVLVSPSHDRHDIDRALHGVSAQVVFHLASAGVAYGTSDPAQVIDVNVNLTANLLLATADWPLRQFIFTGSCSEYGLSMSERLTEDTPLRPSSVYGASKAAAFLCGRSLAACLDQPFVNLRLFGVFGPGEAPQRLIPHIVARLRRNQPAELTGGRQVRDFLYVDDVVDALCAVGRLDRPLKHDTYNVCSSGGVSVREVGETIVELLGSPVELLQWGAQPYRADEPAVLVGDNRRLAAATGWRPKTPLRDGVARTVSFLLDDPMSRRVAA